MKKKIFSILFALVLVCSFSLVAAVPVSAAAGVLTVDTSQPAVPPNYHTIQAAVNATSTGDTIIVAAGTYDEAVTLGLTSNPDCQGLTFLGAKAGVPAGVGKVLGSRGTDESIINGRFQTSHDGSGCDGVVIDGFTINGLAHEAVHIGGANNPTKNAIVRNNILTSEGKQALVFTGGSDGGTVLENDMSTTGPGKAAMYINPSSGHVVEYNVLHDSGAGLGPSSVSDTTIRYNNFNNLMDPQWGAAVGGDTFGTGVVVQYNNFDNCLRGIVNSGFSSNVVDARFNWWGDSTGPKVCDWNDVNNNWLDGFADSAEMGEMTCSGALGNPLVYRSSAGAVVPNYIPWLDASYPGGNPVYPVSGDNPSKVTLEDEDGDIATVDISGGPTGASGTITGARYTSDPKTGQSSLKAGTGTTGVVFVDVKITGYAAGMATITVPYTEPLPAGVVEETLALYYWDAANSMWRIAANNAVNIANNFVSGDIPVTALTGTPLGSGGYPAGEAKVGIGDITVDYSGNDIVALTIKTTSAKLGAATIDLTFGKDVVQVLGGENSDFDQLTVNPSFSSGKARFVANQLGAAGVSATTSKGAVLAQVRLKAVGTTGSSCPLTLTVVTLKDNHGISIPYVISPPGTASIGGRGDVNSDGTVDVYDCVCIARAIAGFHATTPAMDVDGIKGVDAYDCTYLARHIAGIPGHPL